MSGIPIVNSHQMMMHVHSFQREYIVSEWFFHCVAHPQHLLHALCCRFEYRLFFNGKVRFTIDKLRRSTVPYGSSVQIVFLCVGGFQLHLQIGIFAIITVHSIIVRAPVPYMYAIHNRAYILVRVDVVYMHACHMENSVVPWSS